MSRSPSPKQHTVRASFTVRVGQAIRRYFVAGLATLVPVVVTIWILVWMFNRSDQLLGRYFGFQIPGLGLVVTLLLILLVGFLSTLFGRVAFRVVEMWFYRLPIARKIYPPVKQLSQFLFGEPGGERRFRRVVLVQYPRVGIFSMGFVTNEIQVNGTKTPQVLLTVLIPQPPSPVTGPLILVPEKEVTSIDVSVEDAMKLIVSGGIVAAPLQSSGMSIS